ncbi:hypothetical protein F0M18_01620 [Pseudohalioglobus sediminis]|uniref:Uncharacterized protein n=1 Tax=Pseudohalioglobus sediminis TaxID=2606449 RepID=A0A5B0X4J7_9GAMM|nr:hypothetical protein [Pseudohalioglobus sediminis]KAA1194163.1 hypothetical protein F0M18_01620 [Pseudohalioglobus sediminis]
MNNASKDNAPQQQVATAVRPQGKERFIAWIQDPMGGVIAASVACIGAFGTVLSGTWLIHLAMN